MQTNQVSQAQAPQQPREARPAAKEKPPEAEQPKPKQDQVLVSSEARARLAAEEANEAQQVQGEKVARLEAAKQILEV